MRGGRRRSVLVSDLERRPGYLLADVGLGGRYSRSDHGQPPGRGVGLNFRRIGQAFAFQNIADTPGKFLTCAINHARGNFFGTDFEKEVRHRKK